MKTIAVRVASCKFESGDLSIQLVQKDRGGRAVTTLAVFRGFAVPCAAAIVVVAMTGSVLAQIVVPQSVLTQHNDPQRTGWYKAETQLSPSTVTPTTFGELYRLNVSGMITAQPLYVHSLKIDGVSRNILYVATSENHIYGFEIKNPGDPGPPHTSPLLTADFPGSALLPGMLDGPDPKKFCGQTWWKVGITSTPVIDPNNGTMYVVYRTGPTPGAQAGTPSDTNYALGAHFWLAALSLSTLKPVQPQVEIVMPGFEPDMQLNRPGLLLSNGMLYIAFGGAVCDYGGNPYIDVAKKPRGHGWVFAFDASRISRPPAHFNTTPSTSLGGIWQSGNGLSVSGNGVYAMTGNNGLPDDPKTPEYAESIIKLTLETSPAGRLAFTTPVTYMTVGNWYRLDTGKRGPADAASPGDSDLGAGGPVILPNGRLIGGGKQGRVYVLDPNSLNQTQAAFQGFYNTWHPEVDVCDYDEQQKNGPNMHGSVVAWHPDGVNYSLFYGMPEKEYLKGFRAYDDGHLSSWPELSTTETGYRSPDNMPGGFLSISSNGGRDGIVWALVARNGRQSDAAYHTEPGRLLAFDALTLRPLWSDDSDSAGNNFVKFVAPTIADGKVFRPSYDGHVDSTGHTNGTVIIYGAKAGHSPLLPVAPPAKRMVTALWDSGHRYLDLFTSAADGEVLGTFFHAYTAAEHSAGCVDSWRGWFPTADQRPTNLGFPPVTAVWRPNHNHLDLFMVGNDGSVKSTYFENGNWQVSWFSLRPESGKAVPIQPVTAVWRDANHLDLFVTDTDGHVRSIYFENNQWQPAWFTLRPETGRAATGQTITALWRPGYNHLDLFMTGDDGYIKSIFFENNQWQSAWFSLRPETGRAAVTQPITAVWRDQNHLDLFMTGNDGYVRSIYFEGNSWQPGWFEISPQTGRSALGQSVTAVWRPNRKHLDLFMVQDDGFVKTIFFENNQWQRSWFSLRPETGRAKVGQPITAVWRDEGHLDLFMSADDGRVESIYFEADAWQPSWFPL